MKYIKIDPPGTWCFNAAFFEMLAQIEGRRFLEVGCGAGDMSRRLLERGYTGVGLDFSPQAIDRGTQQLRPYIDAGTFELLQADAFDAPVPQAEFDLVIALLIMEHVEDDLAFLRRLRSYLRPGGHLLISVPGRTDLWSLEDQTVGHLRHYDRQDLVTITRQAGFTDTTVWSIAVPFANALFGLSEFMIRRSGETAKAALPADEQTKTSGIREIPFKTVFPPYFRLILNRITLWPLFVVQRLFYGTNLGLVLLASAQRPIDAPDAGAA